MSKKFGFVNYDDHDFYHARLGRGAIIVAVRKNPENEREAGRINSDLYVATIFCSRAQKSDGKPQHLDPIQSIKERKGLVELEINFDRHNGTYPAANPISAIVKRVLPRSQVTFEVVVGNEST
jgi:hypothetical protein